MTAAELFTLAMVGAILSTMPVFVLVSRNRPRDPEAARKPGTLLIGDWFRDWLIWLISPLSRGLVGAGLSPLVFNFLGVALGLAAAWAYASGHVATAGWLVLAAGLCDIFDGLIARARGVVSRAGAFLDSTLDRFTESFAFLGLIVYFASSPTRVLAAALALAGSLLVSYARARGEALGASGRGGVMQRAERLVLLVIGSILDPTATRVLNWDEGTLLAGTVVVIGIGAFGTAIYRTIAISREIGGASER